MTQTECLVCGGIISNHDPVRLRGCLLKATQQYNKIEKRIKNLEEIDKKRNS